MNNIDFNHLQGKKNPGTDRAAVKSFLGQVINAKEMKIDRLGSSIIHLLLHMINKQPRYVC